MSGTESEAQGEIVNVDGFIKLYLYESEYSEREILQRYAERERLRPTPGDTTLPLLPIMRH